MTYCLQRRRSLKITTNIKGASLINNKTTSLYTIQYRLFFIYEA